MNGRFPSTNGLIWVLEGDVPEFFSNEKLSLKCPDDLDKGTRSHGLVSV